MKHVRTLKELGWYPVNGSLVEEFEALHTCSIESKEEKFKFQRVASTHTIAAVSMGVAPPCGARKESTRDSSPSVKVVLTL